MNNLKTSLLAILTSYFALSVSIAQTNNAVDLKIPFSPKTYVCHSVVEPVKIDGIIDEQWKNAPWTDDFVDIEGNLKPMPTNVAQVRGKIRCNGGRLEMG